MFSFRYMENYPSIIPSYLGHWLIGHKISNKIILDRNSSHEEIKLFSAIQRP